LLTFFGTKVPPAALWAAHAAGFQVENQLVVLVVEDDQLVQGVVEDCLSEGGFGVVIASSGENAVELLDAAEGKYRALVTDVNLGSGNLDG